MVYIIGGAKRRIPAKTTMHFAEKYAHPLESSNRAG